MAVGDKIYLADKETLDETKNNTEIIKASTDVKVSTRASQASADTINTKIGVNTDAAGTTTVFARLKQIYDYLTGTMLAAINNKQANWGATTTHRDRIDTTISSRASQTTVNTINSNVNSIKSFTDRGIVKSVQRGMFTTVITNNNCDGKEHGAPFRDIAISPVNVAKAFVLVNATLIFSNNFRSPNIRLVNGTTLRIYSMSPSDGYDAFANWQVIEFY